jgi:hypothetical protein
MPSAERGHFSSNTQDADQPRGDLAARGRWDGMKLAGSRSVDARAYPNPSERPPIDADRGDRPAASRVARSSSRRGKPDASRVRRPVPAARVPRVMPGSARSEYGRRRSVRGRRYAQSGYSRFAPTTRLPGASTSPPPFRRGSSATRPRRGRRPPWPTTRGGLAGSRRASAGSTRGTRTVLCCRDLRPSHLSRRNRVVESRPGCRP